MTLLSSAVKIANKVTAGLKFQPTVKHHSYVGDGGQGAPTYTIKSRPAIVDKKQRLVRTFSGTLEMSSASVTFLDPTIVCKPKDLIFLPDTTGGEVIGTGGPVDESGQLISENYLG